MVHQTPHLSTVAIKLSEKEMTRETFGSSNLVSGKNSNFWI